MFLDLKTPPNNNKKTTTSTTFKKKKKTGTPKTFDKRWTDLRNITADMFLAGSNAANCNLKHSGWRCGEYAYSPGDWELFGIDFMFDADFKPWVLEVRERFFLSFFQDLFVERFWFILGRRRREGKRILLSRSSGGKKKLLTFLLFLLELAAAASEKSKKEKKTHSLSLPPLPPPPSPRPLHTPKTKQTLTGQRLPGHQAPRLLELGLLGVPPRVGLRHARPRVRRAERGRRRRLRAPAAGDDGALRVEAARVHRAGVQPLHRGRVLARVEGVQDRGRDGAQGRVRPALRRRPEPEGRDGGQGDEGVREREREIGGFLFFFFVSFLFRFRGEREREGEHREGEFWRINEERQD